MITRAPPDVFPIERQNGMDIASAVAGEIQRARGECRGAGGAVWKA
jgi:hypothetical protein